MNLTGTFLFGDKYFCIDLPYLCFVINLVFFVGEYEKMIKNNFRLRQMRLASGAKNTSSFSIFPVTMTWRQRCRTWPRFVEHAICTGSQF